MKQPDRAAREKLHSSDYVQEFSDRKQKARVEQLVGHLSLPENAKILDIGCGTGILAELLEGRYTHYTGIDFSREMVAAARGRYTDHDEREFHCIDALEFLAGKSDKYDAIFLLDISEHVPDDEWAAITKLARPALTATGKVYLHTPNLEFIIELLKHCNWLRQFPEHIAVRSAAGNRHFFEQAGYSHISIRNLAHYNFLKWLHPLSKLPVIGKYLAARLWITASR